MMTLEKRNYYPYLMEVASDPNSTPIKSYGHKKKIMVLYCLINILKVENVSSSRFSKFYSHMTSYELNNNILRPPNIWTFIDYINKISRCQR